MARQVDFNQRSGGPSPRGRIVAEDFGIAEVPLGPASKPEDVTKTELSHRPGDSSFARPLSPQQSRAWVE